MTHGCVLSGSDASAAWHSRWLAAGTPQPGHGTSSAGIDLEMREFAKVILYPFSLVHELLVNPREKNLLFE